MSSYFGSHLATAGHDFRSNLPDASVALNIKMVGGRIGEADLRDRLQFFRLFEIVGFH